MIAYWIFLGLACIVSVALLELGKHTLLGWFLAIAATCGFVFLRLKPMREAKLPLRLLAFLGFLVVIGLILKISEPPVRSVPAVSGKSAGVTEVYHVAQGDLTGVYTADGQVEVFTGIPYAAPPVGELRWKEPQPAVAWEGTLQADHFAPMSMQTVNSPLMGSLAQIVGYHDYQISLTDNYKEPVSEDSLYLNIWKPAGELKNAPVLVYVHGGSLQTGQPWYADYSGEGLARDGVIVVNMGYRLGIFGFMADPELAAESENGTTGNYGLLDQIMALQWVRDNIAAFGGDPNNVTLAGESAGSACVTALCTSPLASGLFRRVLAESSTVTAPEPAHSFRSLEEAYRAGEETKEKYGAASIEELRQIPAVELAEEMNRHHHITVDGYVLPELPYDAYKHGNFNEEAQFQGYNGQESAPFILFGAANMKNYGDKVRRLFPGEYGDRMLELYPASTDEEAAKNWADIDSAYLFSYGHACWERQAVQNDIPVFVYFFTKSNGRLGDWHSGEEVYLYGNIPEGSKLYTEADRELSRVMKQYLINFVTYGDPNGPGLPEWTPGTANADTVLEFGEDVAMRDAPYAKIHAIMDEMYGFSVQSE